MSRFFATGSDSESEESSSADEITPKATGTPFKQSVQLPFEITLLRFGKLISTIWVVFTGRCFSAMMRKTRRELSAVPKIKGGCLVVRGSLESWTDSKKIPLFDYLHAIK